MARPHNSEPELAIGMPVFNGEATIRSALNNLLSQTFTNFSIIISDNNSSDNTAKICKEFVELDPRIRYIRQPENRGPVF
jgi:glycosyltransferase involved in cell wall biosynthesis